MQEDGPVDLGEHSLRDMRNILLVHDFELIEPQLKYLQAELAVQLILQEQARVETLMAEVVLQRQRDVDLGVLSPLAPNITTRLRLGCSLLAFGEFREEVRR